ncbi:15557_t:CDS:10 [Funneliformis geosporum]|uniref:8826_t:CDS:1 n=1 Tax=Funneliformis geosporum TaxID=1117311 RepID=A0A9W4SRP3_9GLOM|nr:15557_t:CDS:10 [Funneliformis geosporum]CAI2178041.1 8826_t:CDS:10 [Funneliformis geosporum]
MIEQQQISGIPLSPQISPDKENLPSQEYEPSSPSDTSDFVIEENFVSTTVKSETQENKDNNNPTLAPLVVEETILSKELANEQEEEKGVNNKLTENTSSVTEDDIKESPPNIEDATLELANILNNTSSIEYKTDSQTTKESFSPLLTYVAPDDNDKLDSFLQVSAPSQSIMPLNHLEYEVIHASTWDDNYPPHQLLPKDKSSPGGEIKHGKGWQSERPNSEPYILFRRLGYCALDNNERANYKARELKSVRLDTEGEYIRLVARRCYANNLNQYNQVGIVGITVMGEPADYLLAGESQKIPIEHADEGLSRVASPETCIVPFIQDRMINNNPNDQRNFTSLYSILPNSLLSAANNSSSTTTNPLPIDPKNDAQTNKYNPVTANDFLLNGEETEKLLAAFGRAKQNAVKGKFFFCDRLEDFHLAKVLKVFSEMIKKAAKDVCNFEVLKKQAVDDEEFDSAENYKREAEAIRLGIRTSLSDEGIDLDEFGEVIIFDPSLQDIIGLAEEPENDDLENQQTDPNVIGVFSENEHQFRQDHLLATSALIPKSRTNSTASIDRASGARAPEPMFPLMSKSRRNSDASLNRYLGGNNYNNYTYEQQQELTRPTTPTYSTTPLPWTPFVDDKSSLNSSNAVAIMVNPPPQHELPENEPEPLSKLARSAFLLSIPFFGDYIIACLLSSKYFLRDSAIVHVTKRIDIVDGNGLNIDGIDKLSLVKATYQVLQEALNDNREEYTLHVLALWEKLIKFCVYHQIPNSSTWKSVENNYELLFVKTADINDRVKRSSIDLFILLAKTYRTPTQSVLSLVLKPAKTPSQPLKRAKPTVELITRLVEEFGVVKIPKCKFDKDNKLISISYLNNHHDDVRDGAVRLVVGIVKRIGKQNVESYVAEVEPSLLEDIWKLVAEWEATTGKVAGEISSPPPSPKHKPKGLTEEAKAALKNYDVDEVLLQKPLAKRGTVNRLEQQLMELRFRMNTTNHIIKDEYDNYLANSTKAHFQDELDELEELELEAQLVAEIEAAELEEQLLKQAESREHPSRSQTPSVPRGKATAASKKTPASRGSKSAAPSKAAPAKKSKDDGKVAPSKKTSTSKSTAAKPVTRRGSTDDAKTTSKSGKKPSANNSNASTVPSKFTSEPLTDEPDDSKSDRCCIFCDEHDEKYTEENLVTHYWNDCPVLTNCRLCNIILEISTLDDHMLTDCDKSKFVKQCPRCREVIEADDFLEHMAKQSCMAIRQDIVRCPLCKTVVKPATEAGWKAHLIDETGCTKNRRKSKTLIKEMEAAATEKREKKTTSTTKSSATSKTPARKPTAASKDKPKKASTTKVSKVKK